jgi:hypothetical protein
MEPQDNRKLALRKAISAHEETEAALVDLINAGSDPKYRKMLERIRHNLNDLRVEA